MILFKNTQLIDGTGAKRKNADVLVENEKIRAVSPCGKLKAEVEIDASGMILCPGFMDIHAHSELEVLRNPSMLHKIAQGITFDLSGNCGVGVYPRNINNKPCYADILGSYSEWTWTDFSSYTKKVRTGMNIGFLQPHANLRTSVIDGNPNRQATEKEISRMCELLDISMQQGCFGFSSGIYYAPNIFADRNEFIRLLKTVKKYDGIFSVHHRCEGTEIIKSIEEILNYVKETGVQLEISHLKVIGMNNQDKLDKVFELIYKAREEGFDIAFDQYPYNYGSTSLFSLLPPDYLRLEQNELLATLKKAATDKNIYNDLVTKIENPEGWDSLIQLCGFENITAVLLGCSPDFSGLTISECAKKMNTDPYTALFTLLGKEEKCALMADITETQETLEKILKNELMCFGTDALYAGESAHPRSGNAAIHLLTENCINKKVLTLEDAIGKMTCKVAQRLKIKDRGLIKEGNYADIVVFNPNTLKDNSNLNKPFARCSGLEYVMVNGEFALRNGEPTSSLSGKIILK